MSVESKIENIEGRISAVPPAPMLGAPSASEEAGQSESTDYDGYAAADREGAFQLENGKLINCHFMFGRQVYSVADTQVGDGTWLLVVPHAYPGNATISKGSVGNTGDTQTVIPIFTIQNGIITADYRGMPCIPVYE
jgi:hypothetical protein